MTFAELIQEVEQNISASPGRETIQRAEIKRKLNIVHRETGLQLGVPTQYVNIPADGSYITGAFTLPSDYYEEGIHYIEVVDVLDSGGNAWAAFVENQRVPILTVTQANQRHPRWENDIADPYYGPPFIIYDPLDRESGMQPVGLGSARYRALLTYRSPDMVLDADEPWAVIDTSITPQVRLPGALPEFHRALSAYASFDLMLRLGDTRSSTHYAFYQRLMNDAGGLSDSHVPARPLFRRGRYAP